MYVPGADHKVSDALSRWAYPAGLDTQDYSIHVDRAASKYAEDLDREELVYDGLKVACIRHLRAIGSSVDSVSASESVDDGVCDLPDIPRNCVFHVLADAWSYVGSPWEDIYEELKSDRPVDQYHLRDDKLVMENKW